MSGFDKWVQDQKRLQEGNPPEEGEGLLGSFSNLQDSMTMQMQELSGILPDANGLTGVDFRRRMLHAIYFLLASIGFAALAVLVGLPTIVLKPSKFAICMSLSALSAIASVATLQKPSAFFSSIIEGGMEKALPMLALLSSIGFTLYSTIVVHKYTVVVLAGGLEVLAILYYLSSFVPGGTSGLSLLLKSAYAVLYTTLTPCRLYLKSSISQIFS
jgi:hypothetical protein